MVYIKHISARKSSQEVFKLNPLSDAVRIIIASGMLVGSGLNNVAAEHHSLPVADILPSYTTSPQDIISNSAHGQATANIDATGHVLDITQSKTDGNVIIDWKSFDIDKGYTVNFIQKPTDVALNNIHSSGDPSQIMGTLTSQGQVYLFNQNGFLFGKDSVVDVNALVVTALNISDDAFKNGIIRVFDNNSTAGQMEKKAALNGITGNATTQVNPNAKIQVDAGAKIHVNSSGNMLMAAPTVDNSGALSADKQGQILLVASKDTVYLKPTSSADPFAGLLVEVGSGGQVSNNVGAEMSVHEGNITLAGFAVNQSGRITATTSVDVNGSVRLLARENAVGTTFLQANQTIRKNALNDGLGTNAEVTLGKESTVSVLADANGGSAIDDQAQKQSFVEVSSNNITMDTGAAIVAPAGKVVMNASDNILQPLNGVSGQVVLESGSKIDVSGIKNVIVPMERNVQDVSVQTFNLRDAPYQKGGVLQGQTVKVDIRNLPTIVDASSAAAGIKRSITERLDVGGTINLIASGSVLSNSGAVSDISGGSLNYHSGYINTTQLVTASNGQVVDISNANPTIQYSSIVGSLTETHTKWGVTDTYNTNVGRFEAGYSEGKVGGILSIQAPVTHWDGQLLAAAVTGEYQRNNPAAGGTLLINLQDDDGGARAGTFLSNQDIIFTNSSNNNQANALVLSQNLINNSGISGLTIKTSGKATIEKNVNLAMPVLSQFNLDASNITVDGGLHTAGGQITLKSNNNGAIDSGMINLDSTSKLDVSGRWVNDFANNSITTNIEPLVINAGKIKLTSDRDLNFLTGASLTADGGASYGLNGNQVPTSGSAGSINLSAGSASLYGAMHLDGQLSAFGMAKGGALTLNATKINIGNSVAEQNALNLLVTNGNLDLIANSGFSVLNVIASTQDITVKPGTIWNYTVQNLQLNSLYKFSSSSDSLASVSQVVSLPESLKSPLSLTLNGSTGVSIGEGSQIVLDKGSTVNINSTIAGNGIYIDGLISALAGTINVNFNVGVFGNPENDAQAIWLGSKGELTVQGTSMLNLPNSLNRTTGNVLDGGSVNIQADRGYVILERGSKINVSGATANIDLLAAGSANNYISTNVGSNAGTIKIKSAEGAVLDGDLLAKAGASSNQGGTLNLSLDRNNRSEASGSNFPFNALTIDIQTPLAEVLPTGLHFGADLSNGTGLNGKVILSSQQVSAGGFDNLNLTIPFQDPVNITGTPFAPLPGQVNFKGDVTLNLPSSIIIDAQTITAENNATINLNTGYLQLGSTSISNVIGSSVLGTAELTTHAKWTQLEGALLLTNFKNVTLNSLHDTRLVGLSKSLGTDKNGHPASQIDRSFNGNLLTSANLTINSSQVYPTTLTNYTITVAEPTSSLTFNGVNTDITPLSADGSLVLSAPIINQNGVIKTPLGSLQFNASTSLSFGKNSYTSVSANGQTIPFGTIVNNVWQFPLIGNSNLVFNEAPQNQTLGEKHIQLNSPDINFNKGSVLDVSGNGDLMTATFVPGLGGSIDYLLPVNGLSANLQSFAILPSMASSIAPYDPNLSANSNYNAHTSIYLSGTSALPAGFYTILPAKYALLAGAYLVTPQANTQDQQISTTNNVGLPIVSGYITDMGSQHNNPRTSGYLIESYADVLKHSQYDIQTANQYFTQQATNNHVIVPLLPEDSGQISINASTNLVLDGSFLLKALNGKGAKMDISAKSIDVVNAYKAANGSLQILADDLTKLNVDSLLLGGVRSFNNVSGVTDLLVTADNVIIDEKANLVAKDIELAAKNIVELKNGASVIAQGVVNTGDTSINIKGDSAFVRLSADKQITVNRSQSTGQSGDLLIDEGSVLNASQSMLLDGSKSTLFNGDIKMQGGALSLSANVINIGEVSNLTGSVLNISNQKLSSLNVDDLILNGHNSINFYGNTGEVVGNQVNPYKFKNLVLDTSDIAGYNNSNKSVNIIANTINLQNTQTQNNNSTFSGGGSLNLIANQLNFGAGVLGINGFENINIGNDKTNLTIDQQVSVTGDGGLTVAGNVRLFAGTIDNIGGHSFNLNASVLKGYDVNINGVAKSSHITSTELGGSFLVNANSITIQDTNILLPSGSLSLTAQTGDISITGKSTINLSGLVVNYADVLKYTPGGTFKSESLNGKILLAADSSINVDGGGAGAVGGSLTFKTPLQSIQLDGTIKAQGANANIDVATYVKGGVFDDLVNKLTLSGVDNSLYVRVRDADIVLNKQITANNVTLVADKGLVDVFGKINANSSTNGGSISVYAAKNITLENGAALTATGTNKGGAVLLSSVDSLVPNQSGIDLQKGSLIDVHGSSSNGGKVVLSAERTTDSINIKSIQGSITGYSSFVAQGYKKYSSVDFNQINQDTSTYMTSSVINNVANLYSGIVLQPGVEIDHVGDLSIDRAMDFSTLRYGVSHDVPGSLIITTTGKLTVAASITDGFNGNKLQNGQSWSFQLVSGADQTSADKLSTVALTSAQILANPTANDLTINSNVSVHTGTGDIKMATAGNLVFTDQTSTVYSAGHQTVTHPYGTMDGITLPTTTDGLSPNYLTGEYPVSGGEVVIKAGEDIKGAVSNQMITSWLVRQGNNTDPFSYWLTAWAINADKFQQNIGSFGGGNVSVSAAGNINDLSVMMPTTGKQTGTSIANSTLDIQGGGTMNVTAGNNIAGGAFFVGQGSGNLTAGKMIKGGDLTNNADAFTAGPQLIVSGNQNDPVNGDASFNLNANQSINISGISDAMVVNHNATQFFTYTDNSALSVTSLAGNIDLNSDTSVIANLVGIDQSSQSLEKYLPHVYTPTLNATAYNGSINLDANIILFPSPTSTVNIFAKNNITSTDGLYSLTMSDADRLLLPSMNKPISDNSDPAEANAGNTFNTASINSGGADSKLIHAAIPNHINDVVPARIVTKTGNIEAIQLNLAKQTIIDSGKDIINTPIEIQQINKSDASIISATNDIVYLVDLDINGIATQKNNNYKMEIAGPGEVLVKTGRNLDLGSSVGLTTVGNLYNPSLIAGGSNLDVMVGLHAGTPNYSGFMQKYLVSNSLYSTQAEEVNKLITTFIDQKNSTNLPFMSLKDTLNLFSKYSDSEITKIQPQLNAIVSGVLFNELKLAGSASAADKSKGNQSGFAAIDTLFPGSQWQGDLSLFFSKLQTISGGDINLLVPGGQVNAGVAVVSAGAKSADQLGIVVQGTGNINALVKNDFSVNTSRVFTLGGGDILIWSSEGNIDAGKGAKTALSVTVDPPYFDANNQLVIPAPKITSGSGIRTAASAGVNPGNVFLFAPQGVVNAGEAGIAGTNVTISATAVLGANNISVGGVSTGVPQASTGSIAAGLTGTSNMTASVSQAGEAVSKQDDDKKKKKDAMLGLLSIDILGFGD